MRRWLVPSARIVAALGACLLGASSCGEAAGRVRPAVVAGAFYPGSAAELRTTVDAHLAEGAKAAEPSPRCIALVAPHAGYTYSGRCAGHAYAAVKGRSLSRVIVLGVNHNARARFRGGSILRVDAYATPLGKMPLDRAACAKLLEHELFGTHPAAHAREHSLEVQLPFLQRAVGEVPLVPIVVGYLRTKDYAAMAAALRAVVDDRTLVVASSDFTHYGRRFGFAPFREDVRANIETLDRGAIERIVKVDPGGFRDYCRETGATICGQHPIGVLLHLLPAKAEGRLVCYYCSGDEERDYRHSVSYAAITFATPDGWRGEPRPAPKPQARTPRPGDISLAGQRTLLSIARKTLESVASARGVPEFAVDEPELQSRRGVFVTLMKFGDLRGCIGNFQPDTPLYQTVARQTRLSALEDRRFPPVGPEEVDDIEIEISVLTPFETIEDPLGWEFGTHGILVRRGRQQATYLPQVADHFPDKPTMLSACCRKAGLPAEAWRQPGTRVLTYRAQVFGEADVEAAR